MKMTKLMFMFWLSCSLSLAAQNSSPTDSTGFHGDHFSLENTLELFKKANSLEDFEKRLNEENNVVNNLDLDEDGNIDYIKIVDHHDKDVHAIVLQVDVSATETQDIAVLEIEKIGNENALLQIIGDEDIFGETKMVEPVTEEVGMDGKGPNADLFITRVIVNVWYWPSVRFVYRPTYRTYVSPWGWKRYPNYWRPLRPRPWQVFRTRHIGHRHNYRVVRTHRVVKAHRIYTPHRRSSKIVHTRTRTRVAVNQRNGKVMKVKQKTKVKQKRKKSKKNKVVTKKKRNKKMRKKKG